jgi:HEAT repeat protein
MAIAMSILLPVSGLADEKSDLQVLIKQVRLLRDVKPRVRVIEEIGKIGQDAKEASQVLVEAALERSPMIRQAALDALEKVNPPLHRPVVALLVDNMKRYEAVDELTGLSEEAKPALPLLLAMFKNELASPNRERPGVGGSVSLGSKLLIAMVKIAPEDKAVLQAILDTITFKGPGGVGKASAQTVSDVRATAIDLSLDDLKLDSKLHTKALISAINDIYCRMKAIHALGELGEKAKDAIPTLKKLKLDMDESVRNAASAALEKIEGK